MPDDRRTLSTRRGFLAAGALLALGVAGCGDDDGGGGVGEDASTGASGTLTVRNRFGTFRVPREPSRVVGWEGRRDLETALAVGLRPVGIGSNALYETESLAPFIRGFDREGVTVIQQGQPDVEQLIGLRPDLILTRDSNIEELADRLKPLGAPLIPVAPDGPWRKDLDGVARALGRTSQVRAPLQAYDRRREEVRERHAGLLQDRTLAVVQFSEGRFYASATDGFYLQANTLADLGGRHLPILEERKGYDSDGFSTERIPILGDADALLVIANTPQERADLERLTLYRRLPAVGRGRVVYADSRTNYGSVFAAGACLDLLDQTYAKVA